ncbi:MAG: hypothetical protein AAFX94_01195 [Myxococcota bacterium]
MQTEWVDAAAVKRIDAPLRRVVGGLIAPGQTISPPAVIEALRERLCLFFARCLDEARFVDDPVMAPIVRRFGSAMLRNEVHPAVAAPTDREVTRATVRDRLYNLREALRASSAGTGLDRVLDDVG